MFGFLIAVCAAIAFCLYYFSSYNTEAVSRTATTVRDWPRTISTVPSSDPQLLHSKQAAKPPATGTITYVASASLSPDAPPTAYTSQNRVAQHQAQLAEQRRQAEQRQREQIEREQLAVERARQEQKAAGQDVIIPLDRETPVNVGGIGINAMIHDNDTTSFDVWINGWRRREVPKQKGITQSGTDETLIYSTGSARLYYVWELSGKLNYCRLRVREN